MSAAKMSRRLDAVVARQRPQVRAAIRAYVQRVTTAFGEEILSITLFGSQARGDAGPESDIDLLIAVKHDTPILRQALDDLTWQVQFEHDVVITNIVRSASHLDLTPTKRFPFYRNIAQEGVALWMSPSAPTPAYA
jgi:predicted nucleotidyltransferase